MAELSSYTSLYRRFRPQRFAEVLGQDHVTRALRNAVAKDQVVHAYLFSGPRGTGKTSTARILAKALNCLSPIDGEPCCQCESCISIAEGRSFDVIELDAASNNGVDAIRSLIAQTSTGTFGNWKVYIIDEVHMLSNAASNALLKTLEEPPSHVVFVLATTDPQKVLPTIKSRTQHYDFRFLDEKTLEALILSIKEQVNLQIGDEAIDWSLRKGGGSARDTLSYLDQVVALGFVPESKGELTALLAALGSKDSLAAIEILDQILRSGQDPQRVCADLIEEFRSLFLASIKGQKIEVDFSSQLLMKALTDMGEALDKMKDSLDPRILLELALVKIANGNASQSDDALIARIEVLEREIQTLKNQVSSGRVVQRDPDPRTGDSMPARAPNRNEPRSAKVAVDPPHMPAHSGAMDQLKSSLINARASLNATNREVAHEPASLVKDVSAPTQIPDAKKSEGPPPSEASSGNSKATIPVQVDEGMRIFKEKILPNLSPRSRSLYSAARLVFIDQSKIILAVPNEAHKAHAIKNLADVRKGFVSFFAKDFEIELTSDEVLGENNKPDPEPESVPDSIEHSSELIQQFTNAPEVRSSGVDTQIFEVFPGAKKIDPSSI